MLILPRPVWSAVSSVSTAHILKSYRYLGLHDVSEAAMQLQHDHAVCLDMN